MAMAVFPSPKYRFRHYLVLRLTRYHGSSPGFMIYLSLKTEHWWGLSVGRQNQTPKKSTELRSQFDIPSKPWYYNFCIHHITLCGPKKTFQFTYMEKKTPVNRWIHFLSVQTVLKWLISLSAFDSLGLITFGKSRKAQLYCFIPFSS